MRHQRRRAVPWALGFVALMLAGCSAPAPATGPMQRMVVDDVATIFYGFDDPAEVTRELVGELYRTASVGPPRDPDAPERSTRMTAAVGDDLLRVEIGIVEEDGQDLGAVRCFTYDLDETVQEAQLDDISAERCPGLS